MTGQMLVQGRSNSGKPSKTLLKSQETHFTDHFSQSKSLNSSSWVSLNSVKIFTFSLLVLTVAAFIFLRSTADPSSLLCFHKTSPKSLNHIDFPEIDWNSIEPIVDKSSPYASFRSEQWIVVSVSDYPTDSIRNLVRIKGWQVLAIGNSKTPVDWSLKGTIFLSLEDQSKFGFRVFNLLPYDSYVRKSIGYLFAIQHGAKRIYDADDRVVVIGGDLGKHFDLKLSSVNTLQERILQYSNENLNRTVVNPYIHFGQRSVWPRGLPLENVGEIAHEEFYTERYGGMQYIQQGISNGLPDVDSVFYFTRKMDLEAFDITFDELTPKVALPRGLMVPLNSFNTMFHLSAFWAMMLPASVSSMASDVLRGYWAQRLLWDIGGFVVVYPPTIYRHDKIEAYPFSEEKDLHVNVGRLIKFLISWRPSKQKLFDKILQLSYEMAKEGFWMEMDLKFTASWLQDLLAVGYKPPRQLALGSDSQKASTGHGEKREFVPRKLPSMHLAVKESDTVNYEIGKLIRWRKNFGNIVLIVFVTGSVERTALEWRLLYGRIFKTVIMLSEKAYADLSVEQAHLDQIYKYLPTIFEKFPSAEGFLFLKDNTILNYWSLVQADRSKLWITDKVPQSWITVSPTGNNSIWFSKQANMIKKVVSTMPVHLQVSYKDNSPKGQSIIVCSSELFYIPRRFVGDFVDLVGLVGNLKMHYTVAIPIFFMAMDSPSNYDPIFDAMIYSAGASSSPNETSIYSAQVPALYPWSVSGESDFIKLVRYMAAGDPLLMELM
ncbi:sugar transporter-like protein [Ancistrocladus abbreviatus]